MPKRDSNKRESLPNNRLNVKNEQSLSAHWLRSFHWPWGLGEKKAYLALNDGAMFGKEAGFMRLNVASPRSIIAEQARSHKCKTFINLKTHVSLTFCIFLESLFGFYSKFS